MSEERDITIEVRGPVGRGKSAIAGEIEIALRAIGVKVTWENSESEKRLTHADWVSDIELYKPVVVIREELVPIHEWPYQTTRMR
jgi:hypothetical protein